MKAGKMTFQDTMVYQELLYRIQVLETCKMLCKAAPITTNMNDLLLHYQLTDMLLPCPITKYTGRTLGDVLSMDPKAIHWIANKFTGNAEISAAAKLICEYAREQAAV